MTKKVFNQQPYFDDYNSNKNFTSVLFKPSVPVQVRELNQLQSILSDNNRQISNKLFRTGECVNNKTPKHLIVNYITIEPYKYNPAQPTDQSELIDINKITKKLLGTSSPVIGDNINAKVIKIVDAINNDPITIYLSYQRNLINEDANIETFISGEPINCYDDNGNISYTIKVRCPSCPGGDTLTVPPIGFGTIWSIPDSIYYVENSFINVNKDVVVAEKYTIDEVNYKFGFDIINDIVTSDDDATLFDNSLGYPNYTASGADRERTYLIPTIKPLGFKENESFILIAEIEDGVITMIDDSKGTRVYDTSAKTKRESDGNYILRHGRLNFLQGTTDSKFKVAVSPSTVLVEGYEVVTKDTIIEVDKARTTEKLSGYVSRTKELNYVLVDLIPGSLTVPGLIEDGSVFTNRKVNLYLYIPSNQDITTSPPVTVPVSTETIFDGRTNLVGTITIYDIKREDVKIPNRYRLYFTKLSITGSGIKYQDISAMYLANVGVGAGIFFAKTVKDVNSDKPTIYSPQDPVLIYNIGKNAVKSTRSTTNSTHPSLTYTVRKKYSGTLNAGSSYSWNITNTQDFSANDIRKIIGGVITSTGTGYCDEFAPDVNNIVTSLDGTTVTIYSLATTVISTVVTPKYFITIVDNNTITFASNLSIDVGKKVVLLVDVMMSDVTEKTKTLINVTEELAFYSGVGINAVALNWQKFSHTDIYRVNSILDGSGNDIKANFWYSNGQTDTEYQLGTLVKGNTAYRIQSTSDLTLERVTINYDYFDHSNIGDYFSVNSYESFIADFDYNKIPTYSSRNNQVYYLSDCIDFRTNNIGDTIVNDIIQPSLNKQIFLDVEYYLPRKDIISVDIDGNIIYNTGNAKAYASQPTTGPAQLGLYHIRVAPYGYDFNRDFTVNVLEHRLYKMEDIGRLYNKFNKFKEKIEFSLLEQETIAMSIRDKSSGTERYKNGLVIDDFSSFNSSELSNSDYKCSLSRELKELHPKYTMFSQDFYFDEDNSVNFKRFGDIIMLDFVEKQFLAQQSASRSIPINEHDITYYKGNMILVPNVDNFADTESRPVHIIEPEAKINQVQRIANSTGMVGLEDGLWANYNRTIVKDNEFLRPGSEIEQYVFPDRISVYSNLDNTDIAVMPYARSTKFEFFASGLKPNTRMYCFFDGQNITGNCRPLTTNSNYGTAIKSDVNGNVYGEFVIPSGRFFCGKRIFKITSDSSNSLTNIVDYTSAESIFFCGGYENDDDLKNTNNCLTSLYKPKEGNNIGLYNFDPIAQTFIADRDCWLTSIDLFFDYVDPSDEIRIEICTTETENEIPGSFTIGQSGIVRGNTITGNDLSTVATNFKLIYPVFIRGDSSYAIVIFNKNNETRIWNSHLGEEDVEIYDKVISKQIDTGSFFRKRGNKWTQYYNEDLKINLYRAEFLDNNLTVVMRNKPMSWSSKNATRILETQDSVNKVRVKLPDHAMSVNDKITLDCLSDYWIQLANDNKKLSYGQKIITLTGSGYIENIRVKSGQYQYRLENTVGHFVLNQEYTLENFTPRSTEVDLINNYLQTDFSLTSTQNLVGTISNIINDSTPSLNIAMETVTLAGVYLTDLNKEFNVTKIDSNDSFILPLPYTASENQFTYNNEFNIRTKVNKRYEKFNFSGSFVTNNCSNHWTYTGIIHSMNGIFTDLNNNSNDEVVYIGRDIRLKQPHKILTARNEELFLNGETSVKMVGNFLAKDKYNSPMLNIKTFSMVCIANKVDDHSALMMDVAPLPYNYTIFNDELTGAGNLIGSKSYKYITKMAKLKNAAFDLFLAFDIYKPRFADFDIYIKFIKVDEINDIDLIEFVKIEIPDLKDFTSTNINDMSTVFITASDYLAEEQLPQFRAFQVKLIGSTKNPAEPPIFKNFRSIAIT